MNQEVQEVIPAEILVVDDIPENLKLLTDILTARGYRVRPASGGNLALRSAAIRLPDLILLDIKMPDMDGYEVCRALKSDEKSRDIPVIFISALHETGDKVRGFEAGGVDFITKPFQSEEVLARVETHLALWRLQERLEKQNTQLQLEIAERRKAENDLIRERNQLKTLLDFYRRPDTQVHDIIAFVVEECIRISESHLGFFGFVNEDETLMTAHLWSEEAMKGCATDVKPPEFHLDHAGIWAEAIRRHEPLMVNDYLRPDPHKRGYPEGHVPIQRLMSIPIIKGAKAVAIMAVANKKLDYSETDLLHLSLFLESMWDMIMRKKAEEEKEKIEAQNRQLQKAESLGRMAGAIAHHFNNQLGTVMGNLELAMIDLPQGAQSHADITAAMQAAHRAAEVSGLMLTYLGQTAGKREPLDLSEVCRRSLPMLRAAMPKDVALETDLPSFGPAISANGNQIQQLLTNLVTNAWEAIGDGRGAIHLSIKTVPSADIPTANRFPIDWQSQDHAYACLEVVDGGCGIADHDVEKLFDPFFSSKFTGRGLGLPVVLGIVRAHGGAVTVESEPGRGSVFRVFFPVSAEEVSRQPDKVAESRELEGGGTVLLVEDEEMLRNMARAMLTRLGFTVLAAKDGVEAVEVFRQHQDTIRCVLCDLTMPRMNGWETLAALRKLAPDIQVILTSGYDEARVMEGDHPELPQAFLHKPYQMKDLKAALDAAQKTSPTANKGAPQ